MSAEYHATLDGPGLCVPKKLTKYVCLASTLARTEVSLPSSPHKGTFLCSLAQYHRSDESPLLYLHLFPLPSRLFWYAIWQTACVIGMAMYV